MGLHETLRLRPIACSERRRLAGNLVLPVENPGLSPEQPELCDHLVNESARFKRTDNAGRDKTKPRSSLTILAPQSAALRISRSAPSSLRLEGDEQKRKVARWRTGNMSSVATKICAIRENEFAFWPRVVQSCVRAVRAKKCVVTREQSSFRVGHCSGRVARFFAENNKIYAKKQSLETSNPTSGATLPSKNLKEEMKIISIAGANATVAKAGGICYHVVAWALCEDGKVRGIVLANGEPVLVSELPGGSAARYSTTEKI